MPQLNLYAVSKMTHVVMSADEVERYNRSGYTWSLVLADVPNRSAGTLEYLRDGIRCDGGRAFVVGKTFHEHDYCDAEVISSASFPILNITSPDDAKLRQAILTSWLSDV